jgi:hypothetical protein
MARPPAPYARARIVTTLITSTIWFLILFPISTFSGGGRLEHMSTLEMANVVAITLMFIPYFSTHGVLMSMYNGVLKGSIVMPASTASASAEPGTENPWRLATINAFAFGLVPAGIGYFLAMSAAATMTRGVFAVRYALACTLLCAVVTYVVAGKPFLRTMQKPREKRGYTGTREQYLWRYFALPHGIANLIINAVLAFTLTPVPFSQPGAIVPTQHIIVDTVIALVVLTWLLASGARSQARNEALLGISPPAAASTHSVLSALSRVFLGGLAFSIAVGVVFWLTKSPGLSIVSWAVYRGVVLGVYAGWLTKEVARAAIKTTLAAEPAATPASTAAA